MNVLFVGGGRRVELAWRFMEHGYTVYSYELSKLVPISSVASIIEGLRWDDELIINHLQQVIHENDIRLVLPLMDAAIPVCARLPVIMGTEVVTPTSEVADICYDKKKYQRFMEKNFPEFYPSSINRDFPWIAKPRFGFGSKHILIIENSRDWDNFIKVYNDRDFIFQQKVDGNEYSVDAYFDINSLYVDGVPRRRLRVGSGEVITSKTEKNFGLEQVTKLIGEELGLVGPINMQFIKDRNSGALSNFEVNCRFGGGWTFTIEAGLDAISLIDRDYFGVNFNYEPGQWTNGLLLERSYRDHYYETNR
jgi:carbamoyl-phosphate synthase large subunit